MSVCVCVILLSYSRRRSKEVARSTVSLPDSLVCLEVRAPLPHYLSLPVSLCFTGWFLLPLFPFLLPRVRWVYLHYLPQTAGYTCRRRHHSRWKGLRIIRLLWLTIKIGKPVEVSLYHRVNDFPMEDVEKETVRFEVVPE